jgi:hypothetical protein
LFRISPGNDETANENFVAGAHGETRRKIERQKSVLPAEETRRLRRGDRGLAAWLLYSPLASALASLRCRLSYWPILLARLLAM